MIYRFRRKFALPDEFRRIALEQLDGAIQHLRASDIHQTRRSLKLVRALFDLAKSTDSTACKQSEILRNAARQISAARDLEVCKTLLADLQKKPGAPAQALFAKARAALDAITPPHPSTRAAAQSTLKSMTACRKVIASWQPSLSEKSVRRAMANSYRKSRKTVAQIEAARTSSAALDPTLMHTLRKRIKRLTAQLRLICENSPRLLPKLVRKAAQLGSQLGKEHDLVILQQKLESAGILPVQSALGDFIAARRAKIGKSALAQAARLLKKKPSRFERRLKP